VSAKDYGPPDAGEIMRSIADVYRLHEALPDAFRLFLTGLSREQSIDMLRAALIQAEAYPKDET
jgi:hypothetical protein